MATRKHRGALPGFGLTLGYSVVYLALLVIIPLGALLLYTARVGPLELLAIVTEPRALAAFRLSIGASAAAAVIDGVLGLLVAWVLVRYRFPGRRLLDAMVDVPFALPTAVAGISLTAVYSERGWLGEPLAALGISAAFSPIGITIALAFVGFPFVVRTVQPVLEDLDPELEEAAAVLGASRWVTFRRVVFPALLPSLLTGMALCFARALGEYGSVVFISGNMPHKTEIVPLLIVTKLEQYDYSGATAIATTMLLFAFVLLLGVNLLQRWAERAKSVDVTVARTRRTQRLRIGESAPGRWLVTLLAAAVLGALVIVPLTMVISSALSGGPGAYLRALADPALTEALQLTLLVACISVPANVVFGACAAWAIAKYRFRGRTALITLIDLPFSVSPVIAGLSFVLLFGAHSWLGQWLSAYDIRIIFAVPGIVLATTFVTFPMVARELLAVMQAQGSDDEEAALTLGASGWQIATRVTLPKVRWGLLYGVVLCNARTMGEFGAVSVVSGHVRGETTTVPLEIEMLYNEYAFVGAFAAATLLVFLALVTLLAKHAMGAGVPRSAEAVTVRSRRFRAVPARSAS
jgi:sulfate transport system permease protein